MQFFFKRIERTREASGDESKIVEKVFMDSFNTDMVVTTTEIEDGKRVVTLNDGHTESRYGKYPVVKAGKMVGEELRKEAAHYQSQIVLEADDSEKYVNMMALIDRLS